MSTEEQNPFDISEDVTEADVAQAPTAEKLASISALAQSQLRLEAEIEAAEAKLKDLKEQHKKVSADLLPTAMLECGLEGFRLANGAKVTVKEDLSISIPKAKLPAIVQWLDERGHGDVVQASISVELGRGTDSIRPMVTSALEQLGIPFEESLTVAPQTLKAILRREIENGSDVELKDFGAYAWKKTEIKK